MTINTESLRWASTLETDPENGLANKNNPPAEFKTSGAKRNQPVPRQWINHQFDAIYNALVDTQAQLDAIVGGSSQPTLEAIYPVDSLYLSFNSTSPATALGFGTWAQITGKFLVGVDNTDADFNVSGETGGTKSHTHTDNFVSASHVLTTSELPADTPFTLTVSNTSGGETQSATIYPIAGDNVTSTTSDNKVNWEGTGTAHTHGLSGGVQSTSNLPPYLAVFMYRRVS